MAARKKATRKVARKTTAKKTARKAAVVVGKKAMTKSEIFTHLAESAELSKRQVSGIFDELSALVGKNLAARGPGHFTIPGLCKLVVKTKPARKARKGINPFTGEEIMIKAKPKSKTVRIRPIKALKDAVQ